MDQESSSALGRPQLLPAYHKSLTGYASSRRFNGDMRGKTPGTRGELEQTLTKMMLSTIQKGQTVNG